MIGWRATSSAGHGNFLCIAKISADFRRPESPAYGQGVRYGGGAPVNPATDEFGGRRHPERTLH
jgi:hypothetical protein